MRGVLGRLVTSDSLLEGKLDLANAAFTAWSGYMPFLAMECLLDEIVGMSLRLSRQLGLAKAAGADLEARVVLTRMTQHCSVTPGAPAAVGQDH